MALPTIEVLIPRRLAVVPGVLMVLLNESRSSQNGVQSTSTVRLTAGVVPSGLTPALQAATFSGVVRLVQGSQRLALSQTLSHLDLLLQLRLPIIIATGTTITKYLMLCSSIRVFVKKPFTKPFRPRKMSEKKADVNGNQL